VISVGERAENVQGEVDTWARREVVGIRQEEWGFFVRGVFADFVSAFFFPLHFFNFINFSYIFIPFPLQRGVSCRKYYLGVAEAYLARNGYSYHYSRMTYDYQYGCP